MFFDIIPPHSGALTADISIIPQTFSNCNSFLYFFEIFFINQKFRQRCENSNARRKNAPYRFQP
jgi:hypothetical protein